VLAQQSGDGRIIGSKFNGLGGIVINIYIVVTTKTSGNNRKVSQATKEE
jgi:hypothetical protein